MASSPITSWEIDGETVDTVSDFILGGSKITEDGKLNIRDELQVMYLISGSYVK